MAIGLRPPSPRLKRRIRQWIGEILRADPPPGSFAEWEKEYGLLGLHGCTSCAWFLAPDGTVLEKDFDRLARPEPIDARSPFAVNAVAQAAHAHRELSEMLPARPSDALGCRECRGTGDARKGGWPCGCAGLGWQAAS